MNERKKDGAYWLDVATAEIGQTEIPGAEDNPRILEYLRSCVIPAGEVVKDETPNCSAFVNWVMERSGFFGTNCLAAISWKNWGRPLKNLRKGAIVVLWRGETEADWKSHAGFAIEWDRERVLLLAANQDDQVKMKWFARSKIRKNGVRWPLQVELEDAIRRRVKHRLPDGTFKPTGTFPEKPSKKMKFPLWERVSWRYLLVEVGIGISAVLQSIPETSVVGNKIQKQLEKIREKEEAKEAERPASIAEIFARLFAAIVELFNKLKRRKK